MDTNTESLLSQPYYTTGQLAERYGVSINTIKAWIKAGKFRLPNGQPSAYRFPSRNNPYEWRVLQDAVIYFEQIESVRVEQETVNGILIIRGWEGGNNETESSH